MFYLDATNVVSKFLRLFCFRLYDGKARDIMEILPALLVLPSGAGLFMLFTDSLLELTKSIIVSLSA